MYTGSNLCVSLEFDSRHIQFKFSYFKRKFSREKKAYYKGVNCAHPPPRPNL